MANTKDGAAKKPAAKTQTGKADKSAQKAVKVEGAQVVAKGYIPNLQKKYKEEILRDLKMEAYDCKPVERFKLDILQDYEF